ncbi:MAG: putative glycoside hydrolase [Patescibacteria group bacterium]
MSCFELLTAQVTAVLHYLPTLSASQVAAYKGYDMIIPDHEVINNSPDALKQMRRDNPELIILAYANKIEWHSPMYNDKPWSLKMVAELKKYPKWFLKGTDGKQLEFWPGTVLMNCRLDGPRYNIHGKSYSYIEFFTERYIADVIGAYKKAGVRLDGILDDELLKSISFIGSYGGNHNGVDSDEDGLDDDPAELNRQWRLGNAYFLKTVRETMGEDFMIIGNGGHGYYMQWCNGKQMEYFPEIYLNENDHLTEAWAENMNNAAGMRYAFFNARANAYGKKDNWQFSLCSAMMLDNVIFSHGQNMPYDKKYELHLGQALGASYAENGTYKRRFQNGTVYVDPVAKKSWIEK